MIELSWYVRKTLSGQLLALQVDVKLSVGGNFFGLFLKGLILKRMSFFDLESVLRFLEQYYKHSLGHSLEEKFNQLVA